SHSISRRASILSAAACAGQQGGARCAARRTARACQFQGVCRFSLNTHLTRADALLVPRQPALGPPLSSPGGRLELYRRFRFAAAAAGIFSTNGTNDKRNALFLIAANACASRNDRESETSASNDCEGSAALVPSNSTEIGTPRMAAILTRRPV